VEPRSETALSLRLWRKPAVVSRQLPDRTVLLDGHTGQCFELNALGARVWALLDGQRTLEEIGTLLETMAPRPQVTGDLLSFAGQLREAGLAAGTPWPG
jgi:hypothetical protein